MTVEPGTIIGGRYRVLRTLGKGGMGTVVLAEQIDLERRVALKVIAPSLVNDATVLERLRREARAAAALSHPNVAHVYAIEESSVGTVLVMEHVDGVSLRQLLGDGKLPLERAMRIAKQILAGLGAAHAAGIVHRDIKPENILVTKDERDRDLVKLVDFGIAKKPGESALTEKGTVIGTPAYLAPEQVRGEEAEARSDLWSVGIVLHEMLSGARPFRAEDTHDLLTAILQKSPPLLSEIASAPEWISAAVDRALRKDPNARFTSAREMSEALNRQHDPPRTTRPKRDVDAPKDVEKSEPGDAVRV
jgi:serine/threonine-protein kinase